MEKNINTHRGTSTRWAHSTRKEARFSKTDEQELDLAVEDEDQKPNLLQRIGENLVKRTSFTMQGIPQEERNRSSIFGAYSHGEFKLAHKSGVDRKTENIKALSLASKTARNPRKLEWNCASYADVPQ